MKTDIWADLEWRGLLYQATDESLGRLLNEETFTLYCGFDPTGDSLHVGSLVPLLALARFQRAGHVPIALAGGATGLIGDPSGKKQERQLKTREEIAANVEGIRKQLERFLDFNAGSLSAKLVDNAEWLDGYNLLNFLRDIGKHFTINDMLSKESVRNRIETGISYTEFSYQLLQAYDFYYLSTHYGCRLQTGGSDQWGNIVAGIELTRRMAQRQVYGLTFPLITKADGSKFGKTAEGTSCWLDPKRTSPYKFYQFFIQTEDRDVIKFLRYFTFLSREEIGQLEVALKSVPEKREAQRALARHMTELVHGQSEMQRAEAAARALFGDSLWLLDERTLLEVFEEAPSKDLSREWIGRPLVDVLVQAGVEKSKAAGRQSIQGGGLYLNNERIEDVHERLSEQHLIHSKYIVIRRGKRNYYLVRIF